MIRLRRTQWKEPCGLVRMELLFGEETLVCHSGSPHHQEFIPPGKDTKGSLRPIPQGVYLIGEPEILKIEEVGIGKVKVPLVAVKKLNNRDGFLFHNDANENTKPGSAGCVVFDPASGGMEKLLGWLPRLQIRYLWVDWTAPV